MKEFIDKLIERLEEAKVSANRRNAFDSEISYACAIDIVNKLVEEYINCSTDASTKSNDCSTKVSEMPTGWISCSERLPEEAGDYLVTQYTEKSIFDYCDAYRVSIIFFDDKNGWWDDIDNSCGWNIIAWKALPAPYTEGE